MRQPDGSPLNSRINVQVIRRRLTANIQVSMQDFSVIFPFSQD
ncbi:hypothetical protein ABID08_004584 [Rhizobium binae]|uniref:Uncharacterized protein n=1 Tax=Rhizobium binae TaxID=1138190 RepID=A0ABV2ML75_9HYPH